MLSVNFLFCDILCGDVMTLLIWLPVPLCSHQSGEVGMASFCRVDSLAGRLPSTLSALEEHDFLFQLYLNDIPQDDSNEVGVLVSDVMNGFIFLLLLSCPELQNPIILILDNLEEFHHLFPGWNIVSVLQPLPV